LEHNDFVISEEQMAYQSSCIERARELLLGRTGGRTPRAWVDTYGCQQNESDSEKIRGMLAQIGCDLIPGPDQADVIVINTCAIREHAEQRILGNIGALVHGKTANPKQIIAVCGCMVQQPGRSEQIKKSFRHVDLVFGTHMLWRFPELLERVLSDKRRVFSIEDSEGFLCEGIQPVRSSKIKAWIPVMYGCNNFCTYCIVPYVRGRERSRAAEDIVNEVRSLVAQGYKDFTLLGQNVNSYGRDLGGGTDFADLLKMIDSLEGDFLIRFMTSHPKDATDKLFDTMASCEKVAKHIHLPFQSGNDRVLRAMNRGYTAEEYLQKALYAQKTVPGLVMTSDVIVGFPGETESEFEDTLELVGAVGFHAMFMFIYSPREGTPAAELDDPFTREEKVKRFDRLTALQNEISLRKHEEYIGTVQRVLIDGTAQRGEYNLTSRTNGGRLVHLRGPESLIGEFAFAKVTQAASWALFGELE
jgi:tRNA-2-methylthio-N6-dimethylallyladenosine synthase